MTNRPNWHFLLAALLLGLIQFVLALFAPFHNIFISYILDFLILVVAFLAGQHAKLSGGHPGWFASATGAIYGFLAGLSPFFLTLTMAELKRELLHHRQMSPEAMHQFLTLANSPAAHFTDWLVSILIYGCLTLLVGAIGGLVIKRASDRNAI